MDTDCSEKALFLSTYTSKKRKAWDTGKSGRQVRRKLTEAPNHGIQTVHIRASTGSNQRTFAVHKGLLTQHSDFFATMLSRQRRDVAASFVNLESEDPDLFKIFYHFLYTGQIFSSSNDSDSVMMSDDSGTQVQCSGDKEEWCRLCDAWALGQKLVSISFKDAVVDAMLAKIVDTNGAGPLDLHEHIYPKSTPASSIRKLLVDVALWRWGNGAILGQSFDSQWAEFYYDCIMAAAKTGPAYFNRECPFMGEGLCVYHEHGDDTPCYRTMQF